MDANDMWDVIQPTDTKEETHGREKQNDTSNNFQCNS